MFLITKKHYFRIFDLILDIKLVELFNFTYQKGQLVLKLSEKVTFAKIILPFNLFG